MKKEDFLLLLLTLFLLSAALFTCLWGGERSRHGYGARLSDPGHEYGCVRA